MDGRNIRIVEERASAMVRFSKLIGSLRAAESRNPDTLVESNLEVKPHRVSRSQWLPRMAVRRMRHIDDDGAPLLLIWEPFVAQLANGLLVPATGILPVCKSSFQPSARLRVFSCRALSYASSEHYTFCAVDSIATHYVKGHCNRQLVSNGSHLLSSSVSSFLLTKRRPTQCRRVRA